MVRPTSPMLIFDGDCGFCTKSANWIAARWKDGEAAVPWQKLGTGGLEELGLSIEDCQRSAWWVDSAGRLYEGHLAIGRALEATSGWERAAGRLVVTPVVSGLAAIIYRVIAKYRYRLPGGSPACRVQDHSDQGDEGSRPSTV